MECMARHSVVRKYCKVTNHVGLAYSINSAHLTAKLSSTLKITLMSLSLESPMTTNLNQLKNSTQSHITSNLFPVPTWPPIIMQQTYELSGKKKCRSALDTSRLINQSLLCVPTCPTFLSTTTTTQSWLDKELHSNSFLCSKENFLVSFCSFGSFSLLFFSVSSHRSRRKSFRMPRAQGASRSAR